MDRKTPTAYPPLVVRGQKRTARICAALAGVGLEALKWGRAEGYPWDEQTCTNAAARRKLDSLQWAVSGGCPIDVEECKRVAGSEEVMEWLAIYENSAGTNAAARRKLDPLRWAVLKGYPIDVVE